MARVTIVIEDGVKAEGGGSWVTCTARSSPPIEDYDNLTNAQAVGVAIANAIDANFPEGKRSPEKKPPSNN